jgi:hypothetical protein
MHCSFITLLKCRFHPSTEPNLQLHLWKWQLGTGITFPRFQVGVCLWDAVLFSNLRDQQTSGAMWVWIFYLYHAEGLPESSWEHAQFGKRHQGCGDDNSGLATKRAIQK